MARVMLSGGLTMVLLDPARGLDVRRGRITASVVEDLLTKEEPDTLLVSRSPAEVARVGVDFLAACPGASRFHPVTTLPPALNGGGLFFGSTFVLGLGCTNVATRGKAPFFFDLGPGGVESSNVFLGDLTGDRTLGRGAT